MAKDADGKGKIATESAKGMASWFRGCSGFVF